jgi:hypothetical protein
MAKQRAGAAKAPAIDPRDYEQQGDDGTGADARDERIAALEAALEGMAAKFGALTQATGGVTILPPEEMPIFEVGPGGYYSADDQLFPEGTQIEDVTGRMGLNENLIPLNEPAEDRIIRYVSALPKQGTPMHEYIIEAAARVLPTLSGTADTPEARAEINGKILEVASQLSLKARGLMPDDGSPRIPVRAPQRAGHTPIMPNTRIRHDQSPLSHLAAPLPQRAPQVTRVRQGAAAAASKHTPPMGTVANKTLGTVGDGVQSTYPR